MALRAAAAVHRGVPAPLADDPTDDMDDAADESEPTPDELPTGPEVEPPNAPPNVRRLDADTLEWTQCCAVRARPCSARAAFLQRRISHIGSRCSSV